MTLSRSSGLVGARSDWSMPRTLTVKDLTVNPRTDPRRPARLGRAGHDPARRHEGSARTGSPSEPMVYGTTPLPPHLLRRHVGVVDHDRVDDGRSVLVGQQSCTVIHARASSLCVVRFCAWCAALALVTGLQARDWGEAVCGPRSSTRHTTGIGAEATARDGADQGNPGPLPARPGVPAPRQAGALRGSPVSPPHAAAGLPLATSAAAPRPQSAAPGLMGDEEVIGRGVLRPPGAAPTVAVGPPRP